jgi:hypothetical protein
LPGKNNPRADVLLKQKQDLLESIEDKRIKYYNIQLLKPKILTNILTGYIVIIPIGITIAPALTQVARRLAKERNKLHESFTRPIKETKTFS